MGCWAVNCTNRSEQGFKLYRFPNGKHQQVRRQEWIANVGRKDVKSDFRNPKLLQPSPSAKLCQEHFLPSCFKLKANGSKVLKNDAVPTLFHHLKEQKQPSRKRRLESLGASLDTQSTNAEIPELAMDFDLKDDVNMQQLTLLKMEKKRRIQAEKELAACQSNLKQIFNTDQLKALTRRSRRGLKWQIDTIKTALKLRFSCGDTGYRELLSTGFPSPSVRTLQEKLQTIDFKPGMLDSVFHYMSTKVEMMEESDKLCCLTVDEMQIQSRVEYDANLKCVLGDVTVPGHEGEANHALVFMLGGICDRWKQTVGYHFSGSSIRGHAMRQMILEVLQKAQGIGLEVLAVTSDMGSSNRAMWREFGIACTRTSVTNSIPHPASSKLTKLYFIPDVPHVVKNLRYALVKHKQLVLPEDLCQRENLPSRVVKLQHVQDLIDFDSNHQLKLSPKLSEQTINPKHFRKMNVGDTMHLFSHATATGLRYMVQSASYDVELLTTAFFLDEVNKWFDLMTSRHPVMALSKRQSDSYQSAINFLLGFSNIMRSIHIGGSTAWKPVQTGVTIATKSITEIAEDILTDQSFLLTSRLTQDCLENLFSVVRSRNPVPTPREFRYALRTITVAQYLKPTKHGNYDEDDREYLGDLLPETITIPNPEPPATLPIIRKEMVESMSPSEDSSLHYLIGYCLHSLMKNKRLCALCIGEVIDTSGSVTSESALLKLRDYKPGSLVNVNESLFKLVKQWEITLRKIECNLKLPNVKSVFISECMSSEPPAKMNFACHKLGMKVLDKYVSVRLHIMCKQANELKRNSAIPFGSHSAAMRYLAARV